MSPFAATAPSVAESSGALRGVDDSPAAPAQAEAASVAQPTLYSTDDDISVSATAQEPQVSLEAAPAAGSVDSMAPSALPAAEEVSADGRWGVSPAAAALRRRSAVPPMPSPFAEPVAPPPASVVNPQPLPRVDSWLELQSERHTALQPATRPGPPAAQLHAMVAAAVAASSGSADSRNPVKRSASGSLVTLRLQVSQTGYTCGMMLHRRKPGNGCLPPSKLMVTRRNIDLFSAQAWQR